ncbi:hypothetical protein RI129_002740 [Pyrocoelia pectoralis]|uniref:Uncharacterized protein n=1 Tax=Pyrocoelia pectoralis TaxID=417401 RepID=A0AAN7VNR3_9COLE
MASTSKKIKLSMNKTKKVSHHHQQKEQQGPQILQHLLLQVPQPPQTQQQQKVPEAIPVISIRDSDYDDEFVRLFENITPATVPASSPSALQYGGKDLKLLEEPSQGQQLPTKDHPPQLPDSVQLYWEPSVPWLEAQLVKARSDEARAQNRVAQLTAQLVEANANLVEIQRAVRNVVVLQWAMQEVDMRKT